MTSRTPHSSSTPTECTICSAPRPSMDTASEVSPRYDLLIKIEKFSLDLCRLEAQRSGQAAADPAGSVAGGSRQGGDQGRGVQGGGALQSGSWSHWSQSPGPSLLPPDIHRVPAQDRAPG